MFTFVLVALAAAFVGAQVYRAVVKYRATPGTRWEKTVATFEASEALFVSYVTTIGGFVLSVSGAVADSVDQQWATQWMQEHLSATGVGVGIVALGAVFFLAKLRGFAAYFHPAPTPEA